MGVLFPKWVPPLPVVFSDMTPSGWYFDGSLRDDFHGLSGFLRSQVRGTSLHFLVDQAFQPMSSRHFRKAEIARSFLGVVCHGLSHVEPQIRQNQSGYTWELMVMFGDALSWCLFYWCFMGTCCFSGRIDENLGEAPSYLQSPNIKMPPITYGARPTERQNDCVTFETSVGWHLGI